MGCNIHSNLEKRKPDGTWKLVPTQHPFDDRSYNRYAFLANVRNYSGIDPIAKLRGFPDDASELTKDLYRLWQDDAFGVSWLTLDELEAHDYDSVTVYDARRNERRTLREFLGEGFFLDLAEARAAGGERIVFWFDN